MTPRLLAASDSGAFSQLIGDLIYGVFPLNVSAVFSLQPMVFLKAFTDVQSPSIIS